MGAYDVVLLPSFSLVEDWRKRRASECAQGLFLQSVTTFDAWVGELWELHGDGRAIADPLQRRVIMHEAFRRACADQLHVESHGADASGDPSASGRLTVSSGVVSLAAECVRAAAGLPAFQEALRLAASGAPPQGMSLREAALLQVIDSYQELLASAGLVERGQAIALLAADAARVFPRDVRVLCAQAGPASWHESFLFGACEHLVVDREEAPGSAGATGMPPGVDLAFAFPSGRYAQAALVADAVREMRDAQPVSRGSGPCQTVVTCKDPRALFDSLCDRLADEGVSVCVQARVPFGSTDFGRAFLSLARVLHDEDWAQADLSDAIWPPFAGFGMGQALDVDAVLRGDRIAERDACLQRLRTASDAFSQLEELASDPEADILLGVFEQIAFTAPHRSAAWRAEQLAAASALRSCTTAARRVGAGMRACLGVLADAKVAASFSAELPDCPSAHADVVVTTQQVAAHMGAGSCDQLIACDLTADDYPVSDKDNAASTLFSKLGLERVEPALAVERRTFAALQALPTRRLVCCRPLNDWEGNPTYPAAVLQELIDAYRADATSDADVDEVLGLPQPLLGAAVQRGEEDLYANARVRAGGVVQLGMRAHRRQPLGFVSAQAARDVALPRYTADGACVGHSPSPSQVEAYLECPFKWFAQSRVGADRLDEGFGPMERGTFCHAVLREFYQRFQQGGAPKVDAATLEHARGLMRSVCDELEQQQALLQPGSGRYVAATQIEQRELQACKADLLAYLDFEAKFLPSFHPAYLEYALRPQDGVRYAGNAFVGTIDRIDVDGRGNAVVIDYKGSVNAGHEIAEASTRVPGKVQTRIYAQVVRRALGLNVVGALYVSYGKAQGCAGAFDPRALEAPHLPGMRHDRCRCAAGAVPPELGPVEDFSALSFGDMLDATERLVGRACESMRAGLVEPLPAKPESCQFCPVSSCPNRGA